MSSQDRIGLSNEASVEVLPNLKALQLDFAFPVVGVEEVIISWHVFHRNYVIAKENNFSLE